MTLRQFNPPHPGVFLKEAYLIPLGLSANQFAKKLDVHSSTILRLIATKSNISSEMALRLEKVLGRSAESWLLMQDNFDLSQARPNLDISELEPLKKMATA